MSKRIDLTITGDASALREALRGNDPEIQEVVRLLAEAIRKENARYARMNGGAS